MARSMWWMAALVAPVIVLGGCSGGGGAKEPTTLASALGISSGFADDDAKKAADDAVADCMAQQGWTYIPFDIASRVGPPLQSPEQELALIKVSGFGIAYQYLHGGQGISVGDEQMDPDPNASYRESLTPEEHKAYDESLWGTDAENADQTQSVTFFNPTDGTEMTIQGSHAGCYGKAYDILWAHQGQTPSEVEALKGYWQDVQAQIAADPRTHALDGEWSACMLTVGFTYDDRKTFRSDVTADFLARASALAPPDFMSDPMDGWTDQKKNDFASTATQEQWDALYQSKVDLLSADQKAGLEAIQAEEIKVALADYHCEEAIRPKQAKLAQEVESDYVHDHQDEIAALAATLKGEG